MAFFNKSKNTLVAVILGLIRSFNMAKKTSYGLEGTLVAFSRVAFMDRLGCHSSFKSFIHLHYILSRRIRRPKSILFFGFKKRQNKGNIRRGISLLATEIAIGIVAHFH